MRLTVVIVVALLLSLTAPARADDTFLYQARLNLAGAPLNGTADLNFRLYDAPSLGLQVGPELSFLSMPLDAGLVQAALNFGAGAFSKGPRWLEIDVRSPPGFGPFNTLERQAVMPSPYALTALAGNEGPVGDVGDPGAPGAVGDPGPTGSTGPAGLKGVLGAAGPAGPVGPPGPDGEPGLAGPISTPWNQFIDTLWYSAHVVGVGDSTPEGVLGVVGSATRTPIIAEHDSTTGQTIAGFFRNSSDTGHALLGIADGGGSSIGVDGEAQGALGVGVWGEAVGNSGSYGVFGRSHSVSGTGVRGVVNSATGGIAVYGESPVWGGYFNGRGYFSGAVGVGITEPETKLHVVGGSDLSISGGGYFLAGLEAGPNLAMDNNEIMVRSISAPQTLYLQNDGGMTQIGQRADSNGPMVRLRVDGYDVNDDPLVQIRLTHEEDLFIHQIMDFWWANDNPGWIAVSHTGTSYNGFTGTHDAWTDSELDFGDLVSMTGDNLGDPIDEPVYGVSVTLQPNDPKVLGAASAPFSSDAQIRSISAVGNGTIWVVENQNGDIEPGDYLISSAYPGTAMLDDAEEFDIGHIIAQAGQSVRWADVATDADGLRRTRINVQFERFNRYGDGVATEAELEALEHEIAGRQQRIDSLRSQLNQLQAVLNGAQKQQAQR